MSTTTVYGANDGRIYGANATYSTARSTAAGKDSIYVEVGNLLSGATYYCVEGFVDFDTSSVPDADTVSAAVLGLYAFSGLDFTNVTSFVAEARLRDYGATLETGDWVAGASLSALTLVANRTIPAADGANAYEDFDDVALPANVNKTGSTRLLLDHAGHVAGTTPTTLCVRGWRQSAYAGTTQDPKLVVTHAAAGGGGACPLSLLRTQFFPPRGVIAHG